MKSLYIGSGDIQFLMQDKSTKGYQNLLRRFVSDEIPYYNAFNSPIDACRAGAILEDVYLSKLSDGWYGQVKVVSNEMNVFQATLDCAYLNRGLIEEFKEVKSLNFELFCKVQKAYLTSVEKAMQVILSDGTLKRYINQIQEQLFCTNLQRCTLVLIAVYDATDDEANRNRELLENEVIELPIYRNENTINKIKGKGALFQNIKNHFICQ